MRIGIDIDDTITDTRDLLLEYGLKYDREFVHGNGIKNKEAWFYRDLFYWKEKDATGFLDYLYKNHFYDQVPLKKKAREVITKLYEEGNEIYFITSRRRRLFDHVKKITVGYLEKEKIPFTKLYLNVKNKARLGKKLKLDVFIDDSIRQVEEMQKVGIRSILMDAPYNQEYTKERVKNWLEMESILERK